MSKAMSVARGNRSSPVEALNLIVESQSLPVEVAIELNLPVEAKEKLAVILFCGFSFLCFNAIWYVCMTLDDRLLRDGFSFGKLTNSCYYSFSLLLVSFKHKD